MSSSDANSGILLTDSAADIKKKINKYAFSGGQATLELHKELGADLDVDVPFQYLQFFLEDDEQLEDIRKKYGSGEMMTGEVKQVLIGVLQKFIAEFQERRKKVTNKDVEAFMAVRKINAMPKRFQKAAEEKVNVKNKISGKKANKNTKNDNSSEEEGYFKKHFDEKISGYDEMIAYLQLSIILFAQFYFINSFNFQLSNLLYYSFQI